MSTGMARVDEIDEAVTVAREAGAPGIALLRCNSAYPAPPSEMDLRSIPDMATRWNAPVGLSDHTLGATAAVVAVSLGASVLEKHLTISRDEPGPDSAFSLEPAELAGLIRAVREAEAELGSVRYGPSRGEEASLAFRRSLFVVDDVAAGEVFTADSVRAIRPGRRPPPEAPARDHRPPGPTGGPPGTPLTWDLIDADADGGDDGNGPGPSA